MLNLISANRIVRRGNQLFVEHPVVLDRGGPSAIQPFQRLHAAPFQLRIRRLKLLLGKVHGHHLLTGQSLTRQHAIRLRNPQLRLRDKFVALLYRPAYLCKVGIDVNFFRFFVHNSPY